MSLKEVKNIILDKSESSIFSLKDLSEKINFEIKDNKNVTLNLLNMNKTNEINFDVKNNSELNVKIINSGEEKTIVFKGDVSENSSINIYFVDLENSNTKIDSIINLNNNNSKGNFKFCSVANKNIKKNFNVSFNQKHLNTSSLFEGYGVSISNGEIDVKGISSIEKDCVKSVANQKIRVLLFDKESKGKASPTLKIDCDDIIANHACAIGSINEDHIYYLKTRGLSEEEARRLISMGYLIPIQEYFNVEEKEKINNLIKEIF